MSSFKSSENVNKSEVGLKCTVSNDKEKNTSEPHLNHHTIFAGPNCIILHMNGGRKCLSI